MSVLKRMVSFCLCLAMLAAFCLIPVQSVSAFAGVKGPTLVKQDGVWYYVKDGAVCYDTTLVKYSGSWWYVKDGKVASDMTTLVKWNGEWWYVVNGKVASNTTTLVKYNNEWWYVVKGKIASKTTTLVKYNNEWWYVVKGKIASKTTTLVKYNGGWYYIYKGKLAAKTTTLFKYNGKWYYVENGKVNFSANTLVKYNGLWYYVTNGAYATATTFCDYAGQKYYVENGIAQTGRSGRVMVDGTAYFIKNGVRTNCHSAGHSWVSATCTSPKVCSKCTYNGGPALGHKLVDGACVRCDYTETLTVTLKVWSADEDLYDGGWLNVMQERFEAAHPEYNITWINKVCYASDAAGQLISDPGTGADVYMFANDQLGMLYDCNALLPLGGAYREQVISDNSQTVVNTVTYTDGNIYGFPVENNTWLMYYNKDYFTQEDVKSLDTMLTKGEVAFPWSLGWYNGAFFFANGCTAFGPNGIDASDGIRFGDVKGEQAALTMVNLLQTVNMVNDHSGYGYENFRRGYVGAFFSGSWDYDSLKEALGDKLGVAQPPMVTINGQQKQLKAFAGSKAVGVNPNSANTKAATQFASFLASVEGQKLRYEMRGVIPAAKVLVNDPEIQKNPVAVAEINTMSNASVMQPYLPEMGDFWQPMSDFGNKLLNGEINKSNYKDQVAMLEEALNNSGW